MCEWIPPFITQCRSTRIFREINFLVVTLQVSRIILPKTRESEFPFFPHHSVEKREILSHPKKIFRQIKSLVTYLVDRYFHEFFTKNAWERISVISTLWTQCENYEITSQCGNLRNFPPQFFCKNSVTLPFSLNISILYIDLTTKFSSWGKFLKLPHCVCTSHKFDKNFVKATFLLEKLQNNCFHEFFAKKVWENFCNFHTV